MLFRSPSPLWAKGKGKGLPSTPTQGRGTEGSHAAYPVSPRAVVEAMTPLGRGSSCRLPSSTDHARGARPLSTGCGCDRCEGRAAVVPSEYGTYFWGPPSVARDERLTPFNAGGFPWDFPPEGHPTDGWQVLHRWTRPEHPTSPREQARYGLRGQRIGEASHPGPQEIGRAHV